MPGLQPNPNLTDANIQVIKKLNEEKFSNKKISELTGISIYYIRKILKGEPVPLNGQKLPRKSKQDDNFTSSGPISLPPEPLKITKPHSITLDELSDLLDEAKCKKLESNGSKK